MLINNIIILILASLGLVQALLLCFYLLRLKKGNRKSNIFLTLVIFGLTIRIGKSLLNYYVPLESWQQNIGISGIFIVGPGLWFYGISLMEKEKPFSNLNYLHFIPFIIFILLYTVIPSNGEFAAFWNYGLVVFHLVIYLILSWVNLLKHRLKISKNLFNWYLNILIGISLIWFYYLGNLLSFTIYYITGPIFYTFLIYAFSYLFLNRHNLNLDKYSWSNLDKNFSKDLFKLVEKLFTNDHIFLDPGISLKAVADKLSISTRAISQVINENKQQNFHEFVNHFRINHALELLTDSKYINEKIATIAYDVGFGTVTSFNVAFKKKTGMTPSEYRKKIFIN